MYNVTYFTVVIITIIILFSPSTQFPYDNVRMRNGKIICKRQDRENPTLCETMEGWYF